MKYLLLTGVGALALASPAWADQTAGTPAGAAASQHGLAEIIVTANRRQESSQKAAVSIEAVSSEMIAKAGVARPEDISKVALGVSIGLGGNMPQVYIRGVGTYGTNNYTDNAVAINVDNVYVSRSWGTRGTFFDLDRIEVLKGPQGTLYGRNASGGALNILSARPKLGSTSGFAEGEAGNYSLFSGSAALNLPVTENLAVRIAGQGVTRDGYNDDGGDDQKSHALRVSTLYKPSDAFSLLVVGSYQHAGGIGAGPTIAKGYANPRAGIYDPLAGYITQANNGNPLAPPGFLLVNPAYTAYLNSSYYNAADPINAGPPNVNQPYPTPFLDNNVYAISAEATWNLGPATLTFIPAYRFGDLRNIFYVSNYQLTENERNKQTSFELRLSNQTDALKWVLGAYYFNEEQSNIPGTDMRLSYGGPFAIDLTKNFIGHTKSYAAFGQVTYSLASNFRITGGARYTHEQKVQDGTYFNGTTHSLAGDRTYSSGTWKVGFEYDAAPRSLIFANASTGFKSGGFYPGGSFEPEKLTAFELGSKNRFLNNKLQLNLEAFYYKYQNQQQSYLGPTAIGFTYLTANVGRAYSYGGAISIQAQPTPDDNITLGVQYNKTKYNDYLFPYPTALFGPPVTGCAVGAFNPATGNQMVNCAGFQLVRTPTWTGNAGYSHTFGLADGAKVTAAGSMQFSSSFYTAVDFLPDEKQGAYASFDANLTYQPAAGNWEIGLWGRNLNDSRVLTQTFRSPFVSNSVARPDGLILGTLRAPRTYGVRARINF